MAALRMSCLAHALLASSCAAFFFTPKTIRDFDSRVSAQPSASGCSGPMTTRLMSVLSHHSVRRQRSVGSILAGQELPIFASAGFSGLVTQSLPRRGDCLIFHARACSRAPPPMRSTLHLAGHGSWFLRCCLGVFLFLLMSRGV